MSTRFIAVRVFLSGASGAEPANRVQSHSSGLRLSDFPFNAICGKKVMTVPGWTRADMNEATWQRLLHWEQLHRECGRPALTRFLGRPDDLRSDPPTAVSGKCQLCVQPVEIISSISSLLNSQIAASAALCPGPIAPYGEDLKLDSRENHIFALAKH